MVVGTAGGAAATGRVGGFAAAAGGRKGGGGGDGGEGGKEFFQVGRPARRAAWRFPRADERLELAATGLATVFEERHGAESGEGRAEGVDELAGLAEADELGGDGAVLEDDEVGDGVDAEMRGKIGVFVDVDFADFDLGDLLGDLVEDGQLHAAGAAPRSPEVDESDAGGDESGEIVLVEFGAHGIFLVV